MRLLLAALVFYTRLPIPHRGELPFDQGIARLAPVVGIFIGGVLGGIDFGLMQLGLPILLRCSLVMASWIWITGGLHLDGVMDTADGLAVFGDRERRLQVMADSTTGAFGVMAALVVVLLKVSALASLGSYRWLGLVLAAGWGRWAQLVAIARYPYLKKTGKGAFHQRSIQSVGAALPTGILLVLLSTTPLWFEPVTLPAWKLIGLTVVPGFGLSFLVGYWFHRQLGGHTGDTYGATVEWTEALFLCVWCGVWSSLH